MKIRAILVATLSVAAYAEMSVFDAGDLNSSEPYGLSENEKIIYQSKKKVENLSKDYTGANSRINTLVDKVDGMQSIMESLSKDNHDNLNNIKELTKDFEEYKIKSNEEKVELDKKIELLLYNTRTNANNIKQLQQSIQELSKGVKEIANVSNSNVSLSTSNAIGFDSQNKADLLKSAIKDYENKNYDDAKNKLIYLSEKRHKPAQCNYYLGQIAFENKDYETALYYYKQSNTLYKQAKVKSPYMPTILLNSGISLKNQGKVEESKIFFKTLKEEYPDSKEAKQI